MSVTQHTPAIVITDDATPDEIREAITNYAKAASRLPRHFVDRKAKLHERIDALLDELEAKA